MSSIFSEIATSHKWGPYLINSIFLSEFMNPEKRGKSKKNLKSACRAGAEGTLAGSGSMSFALWWKKVGRTFCEAPYGCLQAHSIRTLIFQDAFHCQISQAVRPCQHHSAQHGDTTEIQAGHSCLPCFTCGCKYMLAPWQTFTVCA